MLKKSTSWTVLVYGTLIAGLGYLAYYQKGSMISLYIGAIAGGILILSSLLMFSGQRWGSYVALTVTTLLTGMSSIRYSITHNGIMASLAVLSATMLIYLLAQTTKWKR